MIALALGLMTALPVAFVLNAAGASIPVNEAATIAATLGTMWGFTIGRTVLVR